MNSILAKWQQEKKEENRVKFDKKCNLISLEMSNIPIKLMGYKESEVFNKKFKEVLTQVKQAHPSKIKKVYHFDDILNKSIKNSEVIPTVLMDEYINSFFPNYSKYFDKIENEFFRYVIVEFLTEKQDEKQNIIDLLCEHFYILCQVFRLEVRISNNYEENEYLDFHAICQGIYPAYIKNEMKNSYRKDEFPIIEEKIEDVKKELRINDFIEYVDNAIRQIYSGDTPLHIARFFLQNEVEYKNLREEYIAIKSYILESKVNSNNRILLGKETEPWDAKINLENGHLIIEVTQAVPKNEHMSRQSLASGVHGYKGFSLKLRTIHQEGMDSFPKPIIEAIENKHKKGYPESRILLVVVLAEFAYNSMTILKEWLVEVKNETVLGNFKEIWLVVDAEKLYRIH